jgi:hypothetical protein
MPTIVAGDYVAALVSADANADCDDATLTGFTRIDVQNTATPDGHSWAYFEIVNATGSEGATATLGGITAVDSGIIIVSMSGRATTSPRTFLTPTLNTSTNSSPVSLDATSGTATEGDDILFLVGLNPTSSNTPWVFTPPTNYSEQEEGTSQAWNALTLATRNAVSAGAVGTLSGSAALSGQSAGWLAFVVAVKAFAATEWFGGQAQSAQWFDEDLPVSNGVSVGRADEADTALARDLDKQVATGRADETNTALTRDLDKQVETSRADEADTAKAPFFVNMRARETDTAFALDFATAELTVGRANETDTAFARDFDKHATTGRADETDTSLARDLDKQAATGRANETDTALTRDLDKQVATGRADETDTARGVFLAKMRANETDTSLARDLDKQVATGRADETDTSISRPLSHSISALPSVETAIAFALTFKKALSTGLANETDTAFALSSIPEGTATTRALMRVQPLTMHLALRVAEDDARVSLRVQPRTTRIALDVS